MKRRDLIHHLKANGCEFVREGGSHSIWENTRTGQRAPVPRHREIPEPFVRSLCRELGIPTP
jgi:mRNA interferase HicA